MRDDNSISIVLENYRLRQAIELLKQKQAELSRMVITQGRVMTAPDGRIVGGVVNGTDMVSLDHATALKDFHVIIAVLLTRASQAVISAGQQRRACLENIHGNFDNALNALRRFLIKDGFRIEIVESMDVYQNHAALTDEYEKAIEDALAGDINPLAALVMNADTGNAYDLFSTLENLTRWGRSVDQANIWYVQRWQAIRREHPHNTKDARTSFAGTILPKLADLIRYEDQTQAWVKDAAISLSEAQKGRNEADKLRRRIIAAAGRMGVKNLR